MILLVYVVRYMSLWRCLTFKIVIIWNDLARPLLDFVEGTKPIHTALQQHPNEYIQGASL